MFALILTVPAQAALLSLPLGSSAEFQQTAGAVAEAALRGDWARAKALAGRLPRDEVTLTWDDHGVPAALRRSFAAARDQAVKEWAEALPEVRVRIGPGGDIKVTFAETLPPPPDSVLPAGAVHFVSESADEPRVEAVLALKRGTPPLEVLAVSVRNEVGYALGAYLGVARWPRGGSFMSRTDSLANIPLRVSPEDARIARANVRLAASVRAAVDAKAALKFARPVAVVNPPSISLGPVRQGEVLKSNFEISNQGDGALDYAVVPDCGCFSPIKGGSVPPGGSVLVPFVADTSDVPGPFDKGLYIYSNDPEAPVKKLRVSSHVTPFHRFLAEEEGRGVVVGDAGGKFRTYLVYDPSRPFVVKGVEVNGVLATSDVTPWKGFLADPGLQEPAKPREGYAIDVLIGPNVPEGRIPMTLVVMTDAEDRPVLRHTVYVQKGIVASPPRVYFGTLDPVRRQAWSMVGRPGRPFKVTGAKALSPYLDVKVEGLRPDEYRILVTVLDSVPSGVLDAAVEVSTDDSVQPKVVIPVSGTVP
jgi:hypothetical protein